MIKEVPTQRIASLQILRAVAALLVVVSHMWTFSKSYAAGPTLLDALGVEFIGGLGVDIFFCLSGFIMVLTASDERPSVGKGLRFLAARVQRIYPIYWVCLFALLVLMSTRSNDGISGADLWLVVRNALLLPGLPTEPQYRMLLFPAWTLVYEMYFYVVFAACVMLFPGRRLALGVVGTLLAIIAVSHLLLGYGERLAWVNISRIIGDPLILDFLGGVAAAHLLRPHLEVAQSRLARSAIVVACVGLACFGYYLLADFPRAVKFGIPATAIVALAALCSVGRGYVADAMIYLGDASYSIYLTHVFVPLLVLPVFAGSGVHAIPLYFLLVGLAVGLGATVHSFVERPLMSSIRRSIRARAKQRELATTI